MKRSRNREQMPHTVSKYILLILLFLSSTIGAWAADPLPSWNDSPRKKTIVDFVEQVTDKSHKDFIKQADRIVTFDNDGTLWTEQPIYTQILFALDKMPKMIEKNPKLGENKAWLAIKEGQFELAATTHAKDLPAIILATHTGMTSEEFGTTVSEWMKTARHPVHKKPYTQLTYQPMKELLAYFQANGFKTYIVSGGGVGFMRAWAPTAYNIPTEQIIGTTFTTKFAIKEGRSVIERTPGLFFNDDKHGKPETIERIIGKRPVAAFGNSDGDLAMLRYTLDNRYRSLTMIVHHTDGERETAYDRKSAAGKLDKGLDDAKQRGWQLIDMKKDWNNVWSKP